MLYCLTLQHAVRQFPQAAAISGDAGVVTFGQLADRVERVAGELFERGFRAGDRLAMLLLNSPEFIEIVYACARLGVIAVPLNTRYAVAEIDQVLEDATPKGIVRHSALPAPGVRLPWDQVIDQTPLQGASGALPAPFWDPGAVFGLFYTSGTTGKAKGVMLTHQNLLANILHSAPHFGLSKGDCFLHAAPMFHLADFPVVLFAVASGAVQATIPRFELQAFCSSVQKHRITDTILIPTMVNFLTLYPELASFDLSSLKCVRYGGSPIAPEVLKRAREKLAGVKFVQGYGLTETSPLLTLLVDEDHKPDKLLSCGRAIFGVELEIVDASGKACPPNEPGEIVARGLNIMKGYWNKPEETARAIVDGWFHTGDVAQKDADGFFYIVDRSKDMIVTGGENVYSTEVESALYEHPAIKEAAVIGIPDPQWGELVTACVVVKDGVSVTADEITSHCRQRLANYKIPRRVEFFTTELPKSGTGKILKRELRAPYWKDRSRAVG